MAGTLHHQRVDLDAVPRTERAEASYEGLDTWSSPAVLAAFLQVQRGAIDAVEAALPALAAVAETIADRLKQGGRLIYVGAGSSGLLAQLDMLELPGTYGFAPEQLHVVLAGGLQALTQIVGEAEDDEAAAITALQALKLTSADSVVAVAASGRTPFSVAGLRYARQQGCFCVGMAGNPSTPLLAQAHQSILLETPPEVISGSTRMGAGTAQKCALNMLSSLIAVRLGRVHDGMMVDMQISNAKLRQRAAAIVARIANTDASQAALALAQAQNQIKPAILLASKADKNTKDSSSLAEAQAILQHHGGNLRAALATFGKIPGPGRAL